MADEQWHRRRGAVEHTPVLDLSQITDEADLDGIASLRNVSLVIIAERFAPKLWRIPMSNVGTVVPVAEGARVRAHTGSITLGGDALADPGDSTVLVVTGSLIVSSPVSTVGYQQVVVTGSVLAPLGSESVLGSALTKITGSVSYFRYVEGQSFKNLSGQLRISGESLANPTGTGDDILTAGGQLIITSAVNSVGYQLISVGGQVIAPRDSQSVLEPALRVSGDMVWYGGAHPRIFSGHNSFGADFLALLDEPTTLILGGHTTLEGDVTAELLREKITEIVLLGDITAPKGCVPVIQLLAVEKRGTIRVQADDLPA